MPLPFKIAVIALLVAIVASLAAGLLRLHGDRGKGRRAVKALTVRVVLSIALFALLVAGFLAGIIVPHGVTP